jgi:hypothetical protein
VALKDTWKEKGDSRMSDAQRRLLNSACSDLAEQLRWHGFTLSKDSWRHLLSGTVLGFQTLPAWDFGDGRRGVIMLGGSSLNLTKDQATDAITMSFMLGDDPSTQNIDAPPVRWCNVIQLARGINYEVEDAL